MPADDNKSAGSLRIYIDLGPGCLWHVDDVVTTSALGIGVASTTHVGLGGHSLCRHRASLEEITRGAAVAHHRSRPLCFSLCSVLDTTGGRAFHCGDLCLVALGSTELTDLLSAYEALRSALGPTGATLTCREETRSVRSNNTPDLRQSTALSRSTRRADGRGDACQTAGGARWTQGPCHLPSVPAACEPTPARLSRGSDIWKTGPWVYC